MLTVKEAYLIARAHVSDALPVLQGCEDHGDFWGFVFGYVPFDENDFLTWTLGGVTIVDKKTGAVSVKSSVAPELLGNAIDIPVEQVIGESVTA